MSAPNSQRVRLSAEEIQAIVECITRNISLDVLRSISIFGSRADTTKKGGDIDILIECDSDSIDKYRIVQNLRLALYDHLGEQKIDIFIYARNRSYNSNRENLFYDMIISSAVKIWSNTYD